ncbi:MAG: hypothetical protein MI725_03530 [Pirellulales bacterium]|nr:hypothetical protein [Pirellulales bacterium]
MSGRHDGRLVFCVGASRSGKTQIALVESRPFLRSLVWDVDGEFAANHGRRVIRGKDDLLKFIRSPAARGSFRLAYHPRSLKEFDFFCRCAYILGLMAPICIVCEELARSTNAVKAQGHWGVLVSGGLKYGITIVAIAQRGQVSIHAPVKGATAPV